MKYRRWHPPPIMMESVEDGFFRPHIDDRLRMRKNEPVFTIGSCFARNVEAFLTPHFQVPSRVNKSDVPADIAVMHPDLTADLTVWHRYNVFSIRNSLEWALEPEHPSARHRLLQVEPDRSVDPYAGCRTILKAADAERVRDWTDTTMATVRNCRVIIMTLGLSEVWQDRETGLVMNCGPLAEMWRAFPGRFHFRVASCGETLQQLNDIHDILSRHCVDGFQVVVTVSPIPLLATFRQLDIVVANAASKSILRAAVDQWSGEHDNVHYFPSYEMILNSSSKGTWLQDYRHCTIETINRVMKFFLAEFATLEG
jgi:hypothetical protein